MKDNEILDEVDRMISEERIPAGDPYFYTRLSAKIDALDPAWNHRSIYFRRVAMTLMIFGCIITGIFAGVKVSGLRTDDQAIRNEQLKQYSEENNLGRILSSGNGDLFLIK